MKRTITLLNPVQGWTEFCAAWVWAKGMLVAGHRLVLSLRQETRSDAQNNMFHSQIGDIAKHLGGDLSDPEDAKRILISAFRIDTRNDPDLAEEWLEFGDIRMGRGLRGEVVLMGTQSRQFRKKLAAAFITWLAAFGDEHSVQWSPASLGRDWAGIDPETGEIKGHPPVGRYGAGRFGV